MNTIDAPALDTLEAKLNLAGRLAPLEHKIRQWPNSLVWVDPLEDSEAASELYRRRAEYSRWLAVNEPHIWNTSMLFGQQLRELFYTLLRRERQRRARQVQ